MSDQPLRQPVTFWQWITGQPGTLFVPPLPPAPPAPRREPTPLDYLETELIRMHSMIERLTDDNDYGGNDEHIQLLISRLELLHQELVKQSAGQK